MRKMIGLIAVVLVTSLSAQSFEHPDQLSSFTHKLKENSEVTRILFLGDSHIQAGIIPQILRTSFQKEYGNAGRGTVFPYTVANSNGPEDFISSSNQAWETFRLVYDQDVFPEIGALGFVMGNKKESFLEIAFQNLEDSFDEVKIFNDQKMEREDFMIYENSKNLKDFVNFKKTIFNYTIQDGETFPELAAKFNVVTTRLAQVAGNAIKNPKPGMVFKVEKAEPLYNPEFEKTLLTIGTGKFTGTETTFHYPTPTQNFILKTNGKNGNIFYGFQFLKSQAKNGVVFNTVGVNGATYQDFMKFPLQMQQLKQTQPDLVIIALGTNEGVSSITKEEFLVNVGKLISEFRKEKPNCPILLISPTDNNMNGKKTAQVVDWLKEAATRYQTAFFNLYDATGGKGYFSKALKEKKANVDTVHFLPNGYQDQAFLIWKAFKHLLY